MLWVCGLYWLCWKLQQQKQNNTENSTRSATKTRWNTKTVELAGSSCLLDILSSIGVYSISWFIDCLLNYDTNDMSIYWRNMNKLAYIPQECDIWHDSPSDFHYFGQNTSWNAIWTRENARTEEIDLILLDNGACTVHFNRQQQRCPWFIEFGP